MDYEKAASELIRALRGRRSQTAFSRRLKCRSNVVYTWESGRRWPTASKTMWVAERSGVDVRDAVARFYRTPPEWLETERPTTKQGVARLMDDLRGRTTIGDIAERTGRSRFAVSRWLHGTAEPRLPDFLRMIDATSLRVLDFIEVLVDPALLPSVANDWQRLQVARRAAYEMPWSHAVLRALELDAYRQLGRHRRGWIAARLSIDVDEEVECIEMLAKSGQIERRGRLWVPTGAETVDTRRDATGSQALKSWWARVGGERLEEGSAGLFSYNLFTVSEADLERLRALHLAYFRELRSIVASSAPAERVVLANVQLIGLDEAPPAR